MVGIGASAGGLEALERFFGAMSIDSGMSFVVIQHLSPDFKSLMDELLGRITPMRIIRVLEPVDILPNTIYILPPRKEMLIYAGQMITQDKPLDQQLSLPINTFFRSLAREQGSRSVAIVLSGTGSDGSIGIQDVHDVGGLVLAQSEESAKFDGMPRSAIGTGCVDAVLSPEEMPRALLDYSGNPGSLLLNLKAGQNSSEPLTGVSAVLERLRETYDLDFTLYKSATIARRIDRRVALGKSGVFQDYVDLVLRDPAELDRLYKDLLIGVTRFFRDSEAFLILTQTVIPLILDAVPERSEIRIWVPGCATGEEPYSLAILFLEAFEKVGREPNLKIFATDMHRDSLQTAAEGTFSPDSLEAIIPAALRTRYFNEESKDRFRVIPGLRKLLIFSQHNLIKDPPFTRVDLVSCRNLLIYLEPAAQNRVLAAFHFALKANGFLFLGPSEGAGELDTEFDVVDRQWKIYRKSRDIRLPIDMRRSLGTLTGRLPIPRPSSASGTRLPHVYDELLKRYMPSGVLVNENREVVHIFGSAARFLKPTSGQMSSDLVHLSQGDLRIALASVFQNAGRKNDRVELKGVRYHDSEGEAIFNVIAEAVTDKTQSQKFTMVLFEERTLPANHESTPLANFEVSDEARQRILSLEQELQHSREALQSTIEELETSGEELQASNEELLASNEEMQSTNEELHSVNEELYSVNSEHEQKIKELNELTADWRNLVRSTDIGVIFLANDYTIRLFSPKATDVLNLLPQDAGRDIRHITSRVPTDDFIEALDTVMATRKAQESQLGCPNGRTFLRRILPYEGPDRSTSGVVITLVDISEYAQTQKALRESELRFRSMVQALGEGILLVERNGTVLSCNEEAARQLLMSAGEIVGRNLLDTTFLKMIQDDGSPFLDGESPVHRALSADASIRGEVIGLRREGSPDLWLITNAEPIAAPIQGFASAVLFSLTDITERKLAEEELRIAAVALEASQGVMVTNSQGTILRVNRAFTEITGYTAAEAIGLKPSLLKSDKQDDEFYQHMWQQLNEENAWRGEIWNRRRDGSIYPQWLTISSVKDAKDQVTHYIATFADITEQKQAESKIREMAYYDALTGLPNRRLLVDRLERAMATGARSGQYGAVFMLDLDNFKTINDVYGHAMGDKLLIEVAARLVKTTRECDTVSRLGGDEFVLILENLGFDEFTAGTHAEQAAGKVRLALNEPYYLALKDTPERYDNSASCGICLFHGQKAASEELLKHADIALYQAKNAGRNTSRFFSEETQAEVNRGAHLEARLRRALGEEHFQLYLQPQFNGNKRVFSAEALIRWLPPDGEMIAPGEFIPFAERTGLILPIGNWVLETACKTLRTWSSDAQFRELRLAVNISARQFHDPAFCDAICSVLQRHGVNPDMLELELTESVVIEDINQAVTKMNALKKIGVHLSLDDFGSGYSSLTYLKRLPFEKLKIDQAFVRDVISDPDDAAIVQTIIAMGKALRLAVTAEGVETDAQHDFLYQNGCRMFQGFLFGQPMPLEHFSNFIKNK